MAVFIIVVALLSLTAYWVSLPYRSHWGNILFVDRVQLFLAPLPAIIGLIAAVTAYVATNRATTVAEQVANSESAAEVRRTVASAATVYTNFLVALDRAYAAAGILYRSVGELFLSPSSRRLTTVLVDQRTLTTRINAIEQTLADIVLDPFARTCYTKQWSQADLRTIEVELALRAKGEPVVSIADDPTHLGGLLLVAARNIEITPATTQITQIIQIAQEAQEAAQIAQAAQAAQEAQEAAQIAQIAQITSINEGPFSAAQAAVLGSDADPRLDNRYINFVYLGNIVGYSDGVLIGAAALADMLTAIPNEMELRDCLISYYNDDTATPLRAASKGVNIEFDPEAITPVLVRFVREMEEQSGFSYNLADVPMVAEIVWNRTLKSIMDMEDRWSLSDVHTGRLADGSQSVSDFFDVTGGRDYLVVGVCDEPCSDLNVTLDERVNVEDGAAEDRPILQFTANLSGPLSVNIQMQRCLLSSCGYIVGLFEGTQESTRELETEEAR